MPDDESIHGAGKLCRYTFPALRCQLLSHNMLGIFCHTTTTGCGKLVEDSLEDRLNVHYIARSPGTKVKRKLGKLPQEVGETGFNFLDLPPPTPRPVGAYGSSRPALRVGVGWAMG